MGDPRIQSNDAATTTPKKPHMDLGAGSSASDQTTPEARCRIITDTSAQVHQADNEQTVEPCTSSTRAPLDPHVSQHRGWPSTPQAEETNKEKMHIAFGKYTIPFSPAAPQSSFSLSSASPSQVANVRIRRANHASTLLRSPARAGHTTRMREMFGASGQKWPQAQSQASALYPQLPNISRKATIQAGGGYTSPNKGPSIHRPESLCLSSRFSTPLSQDGVQLARPSLPTQNSSESWSDDSGYIITGLTGRDAIIDLLPKERIFKWLANVPHPNDETDQEDEVALGLHPSPKTLPTQHLPKSKLGSHTFLENDDPFMSGKGQGDTVLHHLGNDLRADPGQCPILLCASSEARSSNKVQVSEECNPVISSPPYLSLDDDGGIHLSPLSPNVCVERGASRYHRNRQRRLPSDDFAPTKKLSSIRDITNSCKENVNGLS